MANLDQSLEVVIETKTDQPFTIRERWTVGGGCISEAFLLLGEDGRQFFAKVHSKWGDALFEAEAAGLRAMAETNTVRVPQVIGTGQSGRHYFLILEALDLRGSGGQSAGELGRQLAALHRHTGPGFGFEMDNFIGEIRQWNTPYTDSWTTFFWEKRLLPQIQWASNQGLALRQTEALRERLPDFFQTYQPQPSLLHGDLWGGNIDSDENGFPVLYDPACYYGDREADIAFSELFGGPGGDFYQSYQSHWPLDNGYPRRKPLYNLYHIINHYNHFGGSYGRQAQGMIDALLADG